MTSLTTGRAVALAAAELAEASRALHAVERALVVDARAVDQVAFPRDLQQLDLLAQSIEELRAYLDRLSAEIGPASPALDLTRPLAAVKLGDMRARLADMALSSEMVEKGSVDLF